MPLSDHNGKDEFEIDFTGFKKRSDSNIYEKLPKQDLIGGFISSNVYFELSGADIDTEAELPFRNLDLSEFINTKKALVFLKISGEYTEDINDAIIARPAGDENYKVDKVLNNNLIGGIGNSLVDKNGQGNYIICPTNNEGKVEIIAPKGLVKIRLVGYIPKISHIVDILSDHGQPTGIGPHKEGALVNISVAPNPGYNFLSWTVLSGNVSILRNSFIMPAEDVFLRANFSAIKYTVTVTGTNGSPSGSGTYTIGEIVTLSPNPDANYGFVRWEIDPSISISNNKFIMPASDVTVTAIYDAIEYTVTVTAKNNYGDPTGSGSYLVGQQVTLDPKPKTGFIFKQWISSIIITGNQFIMPDRDIEIEGHYELDLSAGELSNNPLVEFLGFIAGSPTYIGTYNVSNPPFPSFIYPYEFFRKYDYQGNSYNYNTERIAMYPEGVYPDLNEMFKGPNMPLLLSEVFAMYIAKNVKLTVYSEKDLNGDVIFEGIGPKYYYIDTSEITSSNKSDYTAFDTDIAKLDENSFVNSDLLDENGDFVENALNPLALGPGYNDTSTYLPRMSDTFFGRHGDGSFKIEFIGTLPQQYRITKKTSGSFTSTQSGVNRCYAITTPIYEVIDLFDSNKVVFSVGGDVVNHGSMRCYRTSRNESELRETIRLRGEDNINAAAQWISDKYSTARPPRYQVVEGAEEWYYSSQSGVNRCYTIYSQIYVVVDLESKQASFIAFSVGGTSESLGCHRTGLSSSRIQTEMNEASDENLAAANQWVIDNS